MDSPRDFSNTKHGQDEFEYIVDVRAWETFSNQLRAIGINLREGSRKVTFRSSQRLDMRKLKEKGLVWSYTISKVVVGKELVEMG
jgi:hypothetical protein